MKKERNIITIDEYGRLNMPTDTTNVWMAEPELVELFGTTAGAVNTGIKAIIKSDTLHDYEVCKYVRLENGNGADVYNLEVVASLAPPQYTRCVGLSQMADPTSYRPDTGSGSNHHSVQRGIYPLKMTGRLRHLPVVVFIYRMFLQFIEYRISKVVYLRYYA